MGQSGAAAAIGMAVLAVGLAPAVARAEQQCGTVAEFNAAMAAAGAASDDVTLTFDVVGVVPSDFHNTKGSLAQLRNTACDAGQDAVIKVYGTSEPLNTSHPPGTLKLEYGNLCCPAACGERSADPNASMEIFVGGTEQCSVTMWVNPTDVGYSLVCDVGTFDAVGDNVDGNVVDQIAVLQYLLPAGGTTWELPNATASNDEVCWVVPTPSGGSGSITVPVVQDVTAGPAYPDTVFPDVNDLAVEAGDTQAYLQFDVPPIEGSVTAVRLTMHTAGPSADGDGGEVHVVTDTSWSEATMTWNTRPMHEAPSLGRIGPAAADVSVSVELSGGPDLIDLAGGPHGFVVVSPPTDTNGTHFASKEASVADAPFLTIDYVVVDEDGDGSPAGPDCDDGDAAVGPDADETCNGIDDDCDGDIDEGCAGGSDGSGGGDGDATGGSGGSGPIFPGAGGRGGDTGGCACSTTGGRPTAWSWMGLLGLVLARRRRS